MADVLRKKPDYLKKVEDLQELGDIKISKIRCHGDYHLGQVLKTEEGFCILDFEGEPLRPLESRRHKTSPLKDVAGMLRSYSYAAQAGLRAIDPAGEHQRARLVSWARTWERLASRSFLAGYLDETRRAQADFVPASHDLLHRILSVFVLDKAVYELGYELSHRPSWVNIPLEGLHAAMLGGHDVD
jgi:maltose alpha-D-glucosyltransferase/alpha-amylase